MDLNYRWTALIVTSIGILMSGINSRLLVIGLPVIAAALQADATQAVWFTQGFSLASTIALLFIGRVSDIYGRVKVYLIGFVIFTAGSTLCGLSQSANMLIFFRFIQGFGSAALMSNSAAIITDATPRSKLGLSMGINTMAFRFGSIAALTLSGLILSLAFGDWRWLFWINVPIGIFGTVWARRQLREVAKAERNAPMDWYGVLTFTVSIVCFLLAVTLAAYGQSDYLTSESLVAVSGAAIVAFALLERRMTHPLLDLSILRIREYTGGMVAATLNSFAFGSALLLIGLYLQLVLGFSPLQAGLGILPFDGGFLLVGPISGRLSDRYGHLPFTTSGLAITSVALFLFSTAGPSTPYPQFALSLAVFGLGSGLFASPNSASIMGALPPNRRGVGSGLFSTVTSVGFTVSFNIAILIMSFSLPYSLISSILSSGVTGVSAPDRLLLSSGMSQVYIVMALMNTIGIVPSLLRGRRSRERSDDESGEEGEDETGGGFSE